MYILDHKQNLGSVVIPIGITGSVIVYSEFAVITPSSTVSQFSITDNGDINLGGAGSININTELKLDFKQINGTDTDYLLKGKDYAVEVVSDTYNSITLPSATSMGGVSYIISRGSTVNNNLVLRAQPGENIDSRPELLLESPGSHIRVISNNINTWYIT
jgi:hypothetical protein